MASYEQDTWELNLSHMKAGQNGKYREHYARVVLQTTLTKPEAQMRAESIVYALQNCYPDQDIKGSLTRWELRGREVSY